MNKKPRTWIRSDGTTYTELKPTIRERWLTFKNHILCSRPFLALHVLLGRPLIYCCVFQGGIHLPRPKNLRVVGNTIHS